RGIEPPNPYFDGESLLALAKAARYLGRDALRPLIIESAEAMYGRYVLRALAEEPDSDMTKGFYQWGSMSFFELVQAGWPGTEAFARRTVELAHWQIDVHRTLEQLGNTSYAHEGLVCAAELARGIGDEAAAAKIAQVVDTGLARLISWQVGSPRANAYLREQGSIHPGALGGAMNTANTPLLRIDVTQHQMHAVILARRYLYPSSPPSAVSGP
ncbi:MAG: hypothetical protein OER86_14525, partial [Phycisphaerae bacterium]|nr:hypothetical protein [Phycisphaerae bacterium]